MKIKFEALEEDLRREKEVNSRAAMVRKAEGRGESAYI